MVQFEFQLHCYPTKAISNNHVSDTTDSVLGLIVTVVGVGCSTRGKYTRNNVAIIPCIYVLLDTKTEFLCMNT